ncbi:VWA domain containing CoxE-like protein [Coleofasciculus chthonoplastes PCC 7420]|uniref:VWA domain containing CoxE-like protein n=1 Tax=Coleofasciculus chthonoplastes PCC 7420 TaxID=118168 RepID=B4VT11_9CYAN|nr:VWA domain-containing protein [Coleofasciculus chthonoplastes]EDX74913.1 VWA domain containing CoxE-like protein [Coleofasciculus chthonoplastes PCC 7420]
MAELDSSLFQVFERLRRQGVPLGVSDYLEVIETIQAGIGLEDAASFKGLCRLLWAKSREDQELFDLAFAELVEPQLQTISTPKPTCPSQPPSTPLTAPPQPTPNQPEPQPQPEPELEEELKPQQVTVTLPSRSVGQSFELKSELTEKPYYYQLTLRLPISPRDMAGVWRQLRRPQRVGVPEELDVEGTINSISRSGLLLRPLLQPRRRNQARLVVLVDQQGSMAPFAPLIEAAIESILRGGLLGKTSLYYFHDCPEGLLYQRPSLTNSLALEAVLDEQVKGNSVLIISDAGSARGYYDRKRVAETKSFLKTLSAYTYLYAWLNPMPQTRWKATTAEDIACMVPMFPLDREGLNDAVNILRGNPFPAGVGIDE